MQRELELEHGQVLELGQEQELVMNWETIRIFLICANAVFAVLMAVIGDYGIMALNLCAVAVLMMSE